MTVALATEAELLALYPPPAGLIDRKVLRQLDGHCRRFIARAPIVFVATASVDGACDVSPRGDAPGFVHVLADGRLAILDRKGNNRLDALRNVIENPHVGLVFVVPGIDDTLRVNGAASVVVDPELLDTMAVKGRLPRSALVVEVEEAFLHCGRAFKRSGLWDPAGHARRDELPTLAEMLTDQTAPDATERRLMTDADREDLW